MQGIEWILLFLGVIAAAVTLVAAGIVLGRVGVATATLLTHIGRTLANLGGDLVRAIGGLVVAVALLPIALARLAVLKPSAALEALASAGREARTAVLALLSAIVVRPLELVGFGALVRHVRRRLPAAMSGPADARGAGAGAEFEGYEILRELARGGSGARLFVAEPDARTRRRIGLASGAVVIKSFDFDDGTHAADMVREGRSLDAARKLGLVLDHEAAERRFWYVMRYYEGLDLGRFVRSMHDAAGELGAEDLDTERIVLVASLVRDIVATLRDWHAAGLWHKDIKPENAIVHEGRATLVDLGLVTPLASHMTLTTHGTEYFRDPELVRQALRGARVSEVDAARFDLYGAGAVLYFVLEGTFPAHGVLSGFRKKSPACLQWIARRAMADFDRRYANAEEMMADLDRALLGGDPWAVRPADLPSMRGGAEENDDGRSEEARFLATTMRGAPAPVAIPDAPPDAALLAVPRVRMTNWWTGAYEVVSVRPLPAALPAASARGLGVAIGVLVVALLALAAIVAYWIATSGSGGALFQFGL